VLKPYLEALLMPPLALFALAALGAAVSLWRPRLGKQLIALAVILLWGLSAPVVAAALALGLQTSPPLDLERLPEGPRAIVVLGADYRPDAREYGGRGGGATVGPMSLERLRYAAALARASELPLLVTGGPPRPGERPMAETMAEVLERELGIEARWIEPRAATTRANLENAAVLLAADGIAEVFLVTHAWHMPRAAGAARAAGLSPTPAPTAFASWPPLEPRSFLPSARALRDSALALHEWIGRAWYALG
jgi:uncharacterized SAM-binding protein YcdF (DUF218 family)